MIGPIWRHLDKDARREEQKPISAGAGEGLQSRQCESHPRLSPVCLAQSFKSPTSLMHLTYFDSYRHGRV